MIDGPTMNGALPPWEPDELRLPYAGAISLVLIGLLFGGIYYAATHMPHVKKPVVPTTFVHMVTLPRPAPPLPKPPPLQSTPPPLPRPPPPLPKPPPPVPVPVPVPVPKPIPHPIVHHVSPRVTHIPVPVKHVTIHHQKPPPPLKKPPPPPTPPPAPRPAFNFQAYAARLRAPIQRLVHVSRAIQMLRLQGTAFIEFTLTPAGRLVSARIYKSSGNRLIDKAALDAVEQMHFPGFPGVQNKAFALPIEILPNANQ